MPWSREELNKIIQADDLHISPFRADGKTYGTPTWIWCVSVEDSLYVRAYSGVTSRWYQAALQQKSGRVTAAGMTKDVKFEPVTGDINDKIDTAYSDKYQSSRYLDAMISHRARRTTIKISLY